MHVKRNGVKIFKVRYYLKLSDKRSGVKIKEPCNGYTAAKFK